MTRKFLFRLLALLPLTFAAIDGNAQSLDAVKERLAQPVLSTVGETAGNEARVIVREAPEAAEAVRKALMGQKLRTRFNGYRVCVFFGNGQNARAEAAAAAELCKTSYPDMPVYMVYDNPYFKVTLGNCISSEEAIILMGRVLGAFPKAFTKKEVLSIHDLVR